MPKKTVHAVALSLAVAMASPAVATEVVGAARCIAMTKLHDPFPTAGAGWGPRIREGLMASRWAQDWASSPGQAAAPAECGRVALSAELRVRATVFANAQLLAGNNFSQNQLRAVIGANMALNPNVRVYAELGTGHVDERSEAAAPNFDNALALQQLFVDVRAAAGNTLWGAMLGRQEFSDGPRQLISLSDGPNLHRSWNGARVYVHSNRWRIGLFDFRATRLGREGFDESINSDERLQGATASVVVSKSSQDTFFEPFWFRSHNPAYRVAGRSGPDERDTFGARLWGRRGPLRFDWTLAGQTGNTVDGRTVQAWGLFAVQSIDLSDRGWKPKLTCHVDLASGGGAYGTATVRAFNPLYASSSYLGEGQFLGLTNLLMVAPGISVAPSPRTSIAAEFSFAQRLEDGDAVYAAAGRAYAGTQRTAGHRIGTLPRISATFTVNRYLALHLNVEHLAAGEALRQAGYSSGTFTYLDATLHF